MEMMDATLLASIIGAIVSVVICIINGVFSVKLSKIKTKIEEDSKRAEQLQKNRSRENLLSMKLTSALTDLTIGCAMAIKNGHANGEMEKGLESVRDASKEYKSLLAEMANDHLHE